MRNHLCDPSSVDASYNRFAFNDPDDLPDWFVDDEAKHHRPQLPIPKALLDQIRTKYQDLASKPIAKVAEARARKRPVGEASGEPPPVPPVPPSLNHDNSNY